MSEPRKQSPESNIPDAQKGEQAVDGQASAPLTPEQEEKVKGGLGLARPGLRTN